MTERKPAGTSWSRGSTHRSVSPRNRAPSTACRVPASPLPDRGQDYDPLSAWVKQLAEREQISLMPPSSSSCARSRRSSPPSRSCLTKRRSVVGSQAAHCACAAMPLPPPAVVMSEIGRLNATVVGGPPTRLGKLDVDQVVDYGGREADAAIPSSTVVAPSTTTATAGRPRSPAH